MMDAGAIWPDGAPLSTRQIEQLPNQPFEMHRLSNHLSKKPHLFVDAGTIRVASVDGRSKYPQKVWLAKPEGYCDSEEQE